MRASIFIPGACLLLLACGDIDRGGDEGETGWNPQSRTCSWEGAEYEEDATFGPADGCLVYQCTPEGVEEIENNFEARTGDVTVETQQDLDALACVTSIAGTLMIGTGGAAGDIDDLEPLHNLQSVGTDLVVRQNSGLVSLDGLSALSWIGNDLWVEENPGLTSLTGLSRNLSVGKAIHIVDNDALSNLTGMEFAGCVGCGSTPEDPEFRNGAAAPDFDPEPQPGRVNGDLEIVGNDVLADTSALSGLGQVVGSLVVHGNAVLASSLGFGNLVAVSTDLMISDNPNYPTVMAESLAELVVVGGTTTICGNLDGTPCP